MRHKGSPAELEHRRLLAAQRVLEGYSAEEVADILGVDPRSVRRWVAAKGVPGRAGPGSVPCSAGSRRITSGPSRAATFSTGPGTSSGDFMIRFTGLYWPWLFLLLSATGCAQKGTQQERGSPAAEVGKPNRTLIMSPDPVQLGRIPPNRKVLANVTLKNTGQRPQILARIETSCPCVQLRPVSAALKAGEVVTLEVVFDPSDEPGFRGSLAVTVNGYDTGGKEQLLVSPDRITARNSDG